MDKPNSSDDSEGWKAIQDEYGFSDDELQEMKDDAKRDSFTRQTSTCRKSRLTKRVRDIQQVRFLTDYDTKRARIGIFGFNKVDATTKDDIMDEAEEEDEEEEDEEEEEMEEQMSRMEIRRQMGIEDESLALKRAFALLCEQNYDGFLNSGVIRQKFGPVGLMSMSFGTGEGTREVEKILRMAWEGNLIVSERKEVVDSKKKESCLTCGKIRILTHDLHEIIDEHKLFVGHIGPDCLQIRLQPLLDLIEGCKDIALRLHVYNWGLFSREFEQNVNRVLESLLSAVCKSPSTMKEQYSALCDSLF